MTGSSSLSSIPVLHLPRTKPAIITLRDVAMHFPIPKRYREMALHPFRPRRRSISLLDGDCFKNDGDQDHVGPAGAGKTTLLKLIGGLRFRAV